MFLVVDVHRVKRRDKVMATQAFEHRVSNVFRIKGSILATQRVLEAIDKDLVKYLAYKIDELAYLLGQSAEDSASDLLNELSLARSLGGMWLEIEEVVPESYVGYIRTPDNMSDFRSQGVFSTNGVAGYYGPGGRLVAKISILTTEDEGLELQKKALASLVSPANNRKQVV